MRRLLLEKWANWRIILASASPRRKALFEPLGLPFEIIPACGPEVQRGETPETVAINLAEAKTQEVAQLVWAEGRAPDTLVIGADTMVVCETDILGKPVDAADAKRMLARLSGHSHRVITGVSLIARAGDTLYKHGFYESTTVTFHSMTAAEIADYVATGEPMDKAGAYGIQGLGGHFIQGINGDYNNVVGLPMARLHRELMEMVVE